MTTIPDLGPWGTLSDIIEGGINEVAAKAAAAQASADEALSRSGTSVAGIVPTHGDLASLSPREGQAWIVQDETAMYVWHAGLADWVGPIPVQGAATAAAIAQAVPSGAVTAALDPVIDDATAGHLADPASATRGAIGPAVDARTRSGKRPVGQGELVVNVRDYGATGTWDYTSPGHDDTAAILAAINALGAQGGVVFFPPTPGDTAYKMTAPLPNRSGITYLGGGREATKIRWTSASMLAPTTGISGVAFEHVNLAVSPGGDHLINLEGGGGLFMSVFRDCILRTGVNDKSILRQRGTGDLVEVLFENCDMYRNKTATVPAFDIINTGGAANANVWRRVRANSADCTTTPFWRIEAHHSVGSYAYDNSFIDVVGEQNPGGLVHVYSPNGLTLQNVVDWDTQVPYVDHVIKVDRSGTGPWPQKVTAINAGRRGGTLTGGVKDFWAPLSGPSHFVLISVGNHTDAPEIQAPDSSVVFDPYVTRYNSRAEYRGKSTLPAVWALPMLATSPGARFQEGVTGYTGALTGWRKFNEAHDRFNINGEGGLRWNNPDTGAQDLGIKRGAAGQLQIEFASTTTAAPAAGAAGALPATPAGYLRVWIGGVLRHLPYY